MASRARVEFLALGPFEVRLDGASIDVGGRRPRSLLAVLLLSRGSVTSRARLIDALWGDRPPPSADKSIQIYVSNLRKRLGEDVILTRGGGYELGPGAAAADVDRFAELVAAGHRLRATGEPEAAAARLREALALWRGPALADLAAEPFAPPEIARLDELRLAAVEERIEAELALGAHALLVPELERLVREHPLRERLRGALMLALYRTGRQGDALAVYRDAHRTLRDELGLEPSPDLKELERAILAQEQAVAPPRRPRLPARRRRRTRAAVAAGLLVALIAAAAWLAAARPASSIPAHVAPNSVAVLDLRTNRLAAELRVGELPGAIAAADGSVWVASAGDRTVTRIDAARRAAVDRMDVDVVGDALAVGRGATWVGSASRNEIVRIDTATGRTTRSALRPRNGSEACSSDDFPLLHSRFPRPLFVADLAVGPEAVWFTCATHMLARVEPLTGEVVPVAYPGRLPVALAHGLGSLWVANLDEDSITAVDEFTGDTLATITLPGQPSGIAVAAGSLWVTACAQDAVWRIDLDDRGLAPAGLDRIGVGAAPKGLAAGGGAVWVANSGDGTITRLDERTGKVAATIEVGHRPDRLAVTDGHVWISVQPSPRPRGGCTYP